MGQVVLVVTGTPGPQGNKGDQGDQGIQGAQGVGVIVLDAAQAVPGGTPTGTLILRRP